MRFEDGGPAYLSRTPSSAGNRKTWTWSSWVKRGNLGSVQNIFVFGAANTDQVTLAIHTDKISFSVIVGNTTTVEYVTTQVLRDPSAWYHIVVSGDTTPGSPLFKVYLNGEQVTDFSTSTNSAAQNLDTQANNTVVHRIGERAFSSSQPFDGYLAEVHWIDGTALTPASFGKTHSSTNQWIPKQVTGLTYGTNGFYEKFSTTDLANSFTDDHVLSTQTAFTPSETLTCDILLVGGGGSGGNGQGGGGGAGQVRAIAGQSMSATSHAVTVASGGDNANAIFSIGTNGGITSLGSLPTAIGGGGGGSYDGNSGLDGASGGGGGGREGNGVNNVPGGSGSAGNNGGQGTMRQGGAYGGNGGGGGAGGAGSNGVQQGVGGAGGIGVTNDYRTGSAVYYGGGGGGADYSANAGGAGGQGGGGRAATTGGGTDQLPGTANTGGGGGGGAIVKGAAGGSGIVVVRYQSNTQKATGGTVTTYGSGASQYYVHSFTDVAHTITANGDVANTRAQYKVGNSSIKFDGTGDYLSTASSGMGLAGDYTIECWFNTASSTSDNGIISNKYNNSSFNGNFSLRLNDGGNSNDIAFRPYNGTVAEGGLVTSGTGAWSDNTWTHVAVVRSGSGTGNVKMYIGGSLAGTSAGASSSTILGNAGDLNIGRQESASAGTNYLNGYMDEIRISSSARYAGTFTPSATAFTADANTLLLIHSEWNGGLGADSSGNKNDFALTNITASDQVLDSPTNNFCTMNSVGSFRNPDSGGTLSEGNLKLFTGTGTGAYTDSYGTFSFSSGKWYFEAVIVDKSAGMYFGITDPSVIGKANSIYPQNQVSTIAWNPTESSGFIRIDNSDTTYSANTSAGAILGIAIDMDNDTIRGSINGTNYANVDISGSAVGSGVRVPFFCAFGQSGGDTGSQIINFGQDSSFAGQKTAQGNQDGNKKGDFYYAPPSGFLALCTDNLPDPTIADPTAHFITNIWTGSGADNRTITSGFDPGLSWIKRRNGTNWHSLSDSVRAANPMPVLYSNDTSAEATDANALAFVSNGYTVDDNNYYNASAGTYVGWTWKAGGAASANTDGTINSSVSANTTAGFSIVTFTGNQTSGATVGHGLSQAPEMVIVKGRSFADSWGIYHFPSMGNTHGVLLNSSVAKIDSATYWNDTTAGASVFTLGNDTMINKTGQTMLAYCFHSVDGFSKVGSYEGNANANGPFVYTGFKPAVVIAKCADAVSSWDIVDNKRDPDNGVTQRLTPNGTAVEETANPPVVDFLSNGFKVRTTSGSYNNATSDTQLYIAFAETPFKTANAR